MRLYALAAVVIIGVPTAYYLLVTPHAQTSLSAPSTTKFNSPHSATLVPKDLPSAANKLSSESEVSFERQTNDLATTPLDITTNAVDLGPDITPEDVPVSETGEIIDLGPRIAPEDEPIARHNTEIVDLGPSISPDEDDYYYTNNLSKNEPVVDLGDPINVEDAAGHSYESAVYIDLGPTLDAGPGRPIQ